LATVQAEIAGMIRIALKKLVMKKDAVPGRHHRCDL